MGRHGIGSSGSDDDLNLETDEIGCEVREAIRWDRRAIAASLLVCFLYGTLAWGVLPIKPEVSWETHLAAAMIGLVLAIALRRLDIPPRKRYAWEAEKDEYEDT